MTQRDTPPPGWHTPFLDMDFSSSSPLNTPPRERTVSVSALTWDDHLRPPHCSASPLLKELFRQYKHVLHCFDFRAGLNGFRTTRTSPQLRSLVLERNSTQCAICGFCTGGHRQLLDPVHRLHWPVSQQEKVRVAHLFKQQEIAQLFKVNLFSEIEQERKEKSSAVSEIKAPAVNNSNFITLCGTAVQRTGEGAITSELSCHGAFDHGELCILPRADGHFEILASKHYSFLQRTVNRNSVLGKLMSYCSPPALEAHAAFCLVGSHTPRLRLASGHAIHRVARILAKRVV